MLPVHAQLLPSESLHLQSVVGGGLVTFIHRIADNTNSRKSLSSDAPAAAKAVSDSSLNLTKRALEATAAPLLYVYPPELAVAAVWVRLDDRCPVSRRGFEHL